MSSPSSPNQSLSRRVSYAGVKTTYTKPLTNPCTSRECPLIFPHNAGLYLHEGKPAPLPHWTWPFGLNNPPPEILAACERQQHQVGSAEDIYNDQVACARFSKVHVGYSGPRGSRNGSASEQTGSPGGGKKTWSPSDEISGARSLEEEFGSFNFDSNSSAMGSSSSVVRSPRQMK